MSYDQARVSQVIKDGLFKNWSEGEIIRMVMDLFGFDIKEATSIVHAGIKKENDLNLPEERRNKGAARYGKVLKNVSYHIKYTDGSTPPSPEGNLLDQAEKRFPFSEGDKLQVTMPDGSVKMYVYDGGMLVKA